MSKDGQYIIWGSAGHAKVLSDVIGLRGGRVVALFDNDPAIVSSLPGVPLFYGIAGFREWAEGQESLDGISAAIAIGGARGRDRQELAELWHTAGLLLPCLIHPSAVVSESSIMGKGCHVLAQAVVAADVTMGGFCIVNNSATVDHECRLGSGVHVAPGAVLCGCVTVKDNSMIGAGAVVLPRLTIGTNVLVGAGAVVTHDVPDGVVVAGNPARIF